MRVGVCGLWHLGSVTAACVAEMGHSVLGFDPEAAVVAGLSAGRPPLAEPGLPELVAAGIAAGRLSFTSRAADLAAVDALWITFDTPVDENDQADVEFVRRQSSAAIGQLRPGSLVVLSSQVPVGFVRSLESAHAAQQLHFACLPENLRLGGALDSFRKPERIVAGVRNETAKKRVAELLAPLGAPIEWMSHESAEMTKHALNAFLATSVTFINEIARLCEVVGADAKEVERGLKTERRIGPKAYLAPGAAFAGGTLARDVQFLTALGKAKGVETPLCAGVWAGNEAHRSWVRTHLRRLLGSGESKPVVAVLGLTYKPGTSTLRRSLAVDLCRWLTEQGVAVQAHDPQAEGLPGELQGVRRVETAADVLDGADVAVVATEWPEYRTLAASEFLARMRRPCVMDPNHFLSQKLAGQPGVSYFATGKSAA